MIKQSMIFSKNIAALFIIFIVIASILSDMLDDGAALQKELDIKSIHVLEKTDKITYLERTDTEFYRKQSLIIRYQNKDLSNIDRNTMMKDFEYILKNDGWRYIRTSEVKENNSIVLHYKSGNFDCTVGFRPDKIIVYFRKD